MSKLKALEDISNERDAQLSKAIGSDTEIFDKSNSRNDWVAYITAYVGRASDKCARNERECCQFRENLVKAAALCVAAIEANDKGYC
jgi:hypothetical protein